MAEEEGGGAWVGLWALQTSPIWKLKDKTGADGGFGSQQDEGFGPSALLPRCRAAC